MFGQDLRDEYIRHFLHGEFVIGREFEARLSKTFLPKITARELSALAELMRSTCSCVVKVGSHKRWVVRHCYMQLRRENGQPQTVGRPTLLNAKGASTPLCQLYRLALYCLVPL